MGGYVKKKHCTFFLLLRYNEISKYHGPLNSYTFDHSTGHFTQLAWAETSEVGCGHSKWHDGKYFRKLVVCNYGEAGNREKKPLFQEGSPCSACPQGTACKDSLCAG